MAYLRNALVGALLAGIGSAVVALGGSAWVGYLHTPLDSLGWLWAVSAPFAVLASVSVSRLGRPRKGPLVALIVAVGVVACAGSLGAVAVEATRRGLGQVNVEGYLAWCWIYALALLPLSFPLSLLAMRLTTGPP